MTGRWLKTVLATLVVGVVSVGTAAAAPIVGQLNWDDGEFGSIFVVANQSSPDMPGVFSNITLRIFEDAAGSVELDTYTFGGTLDPGGSVTTLDDFSFFLAFGTALAVELTLDFAPSTPGAPVQQLVTLIAGTCSAVDQEHCLNVADGGSSRAGTAVINAVPEPSALLLLGCGLGGLILGRRRR